MGLVISVKIAEERAGVLNSQLERINWQTQDAALQSREWRSSAKGNMTENQSADEESIVKLTLRNINGWVNQIYEDDSAARRYGAKTKSLAKPAAELLVDLAKITAAAVGFWSVIGALVVVRYLLSADVPLPVQISDITTLALPTLVISAFFIANLSVLVAIPLGVRKLNKRYIASNGGKGLRGLCPYLWCYGLWLGTATAFLVFMTWASTGRSTSPDEFWCICALVFATYISLFLYGRRKQFRLPTASDVFLSSIFLLIPWGAILLVTFNIMMGIRGIQDWMYPVAAILPVGLTCYMLWQRDKPAPPLVPITLIPFLVIFLYPSNWGGLALRVLGIGGDLPVSLSIRETPRGGSVAIARQVSGCLVLATNADIYLRQDIPRRECHLRGQYETFLHKAAPTFAYHGLMRYARADVLTISEYPKIYWIDARSRGLLGLAERPSDAALPAEIQYRKERGFTKIYSVATSGEPYEEEGPKAKMSFARVPEIPDRGVPSSKNSREAFLTLASQLKDELNRGTNIVIEGEKAHGPASFFAVCVLVAKGMKPDEAVDSISTLLGRRAIDTDEQKEFLNEAAERFPSARL
jgi:hypothetical protein